MKPHIPAGTACFAVGNDWLFYNRNRRRPTHRVRVLIGEAMRDTPAPLIALAFVVGVVVGVVLVGGV
jgi:hypothetical protein